MDKVRFAVITDIHYGPDAGSKYGSKAAGLLDVFTKAAAGYELDCIVDMGDRVTAHNHDDAVKNMQAVKEQFNKVAIPTYSVIGNHDLLHMTRDENAQIMGNPGTSYSRDIKGHHFVFFNPPLDLAHNGLHMNQEELDWLEQDLASTDKPTIVFSHVPLDNDEADNKSGRAASKSDRLYFFYPEGPKVRDIMEKSGKVVMAMAGHRHTNRYREINGIHYITQQSLVQAYEKHYRKPHRAWTIIDINDDEIMVRLKGRAPMRLQGSITKKFTLIPRTSPDFVPKKIPDSAPEGMDTWVPNDDDIPTPDSGTKAVDGSAPIIVPEGVLPNLEGQTTTPDNTAGTRPDPAAAQPEQIPDPPAQPKPPEPSSL